MLFMYSYSVKHLTFIHPKKDLVETVYASLLKTDITGNAIYHAGIARLYPLMNEADQTFRADAVFTTDTTQQLFYSQLS